MTPELSPFEALFAQPSLSLTAPMDVLQPRLMDGLTQFCHSRSPSRFMLLTAQEDEAYFQLIAETVNRLLPKNDGVIGSRYVVAGNNVTVQPAAGREDNFAGRADCRYQNWIEHEQLFGCVRCYRDTIHIQPGKIHEANGGVLILSAKALVSQPLMWLRLKQMLTVQRFDWLALDETRPLPVSIPSMPLDLRLIIIGSRESLADLSDMDPDLTQLALYSEFESDVKLDAVEDMQNWCGYVNSRLHNMNLPPLAPDAWPEMLWQAVRFSGDQYQLPLCPQWLARRFKEAALYGEPGAITAEALYNSNQTRIWRESYLAERMRDDIAEGQIMVETEGEMVGQVNALSVLDFPGHPLPLGEPSRISCVVHLGDGEINDVERKAELGGNIHAKGMMIMQAFLMASLELDQQLPFSASMVFEQSYGEVDGDSASLAELSALISALSGKPVRQHIAVTGSVDQFGRVQPIGGVNEKIEGFFALCQSRGLDGTHGVIIPAVNVRHLCLHEDVVDAVRNDKFHLWPVESIDEAMELLTGIPYDHERKPNLIASVRERIAYINQHERQRLPWGFRWLSWFNQS